MIKHMIILIVTEKTFDKTPNFHDENNQQTKNGREHLQLDKGYLQNPTANIIFSGEKQDAFP